MTDAKPADDTEGVSDEESESTLLKVADRLAVRFPAVPEAIIATIVREEYESLATGRIRIYIPTLIEKATRDRLHREFGGVITRG